MNLRFPPTFDRLAERHGLEKIKTIRDSDVLSFLKEDGAFWHVAGRLPLATCDLRPACSTFKQKGYYRFHPGYGLRCSATPGRIWPCFALRRTACAGADDRIKKPCAMPATIDVAPPQTTTGVEYVVSSDEDLERLYRIIIENDDVTPMEFVVMVLLTIFELDFDRALHVMLEAHQKGRAYVMTLPFEEAQQRVYEAQSRAREVGYPLSFYLEPDE
jgi:ATP-dependent Clp protease adaptor protein ClpS